MENNIKLNIVKKNNSICSDLSCINYIKNNTLFNYPKPELITFNSIITKYIKYIILLVFLIFIYFYILKST